MKKIIITFLIFFSFASQVFGAEISFENKETVKVNQNFTLNVTLDTEGQSINSVEAEIAFDPEAVEFLGYKNQGGILNMWVKQPQVVGNKIVFSGIIPGGVEGTFDPNFQSLQNLDLVYLNFRAKKIGDSAFSIEKAQVLKNDGLGTPLSVKSGVSKIKVIPTDLSKEDEEVRLESSKDKLPPEEFTVYFNSSNKDANTPDMIVFQTQDKDSGVAKYQIRLAGEWQDVTSPFPVKKNFFDRTIIVRALDFAGNIRESEVKIPGDVSFATFMVILLIILGGFFASKLLKYKHGKKP